MKNIFVHVIVMSVFVVGCQSGLYKISTSEDDKTIDESVRYYEVESNECDIAFIKDKGTSPDGVLYDEERMPVLITEGKSNKVPHKPGWSGVLWMFTLGVFPMCQSEYMTQEVTVESPLGKKTGSYRLDAKRWIGWIPLFVGYPGFADERDAEAKLPNQRLEGIGKDKLVRNLIGAFSFKEYAEFAKSKNAERKAEIDRIRSVSQKVDGLISKAQFDDAIAAIENEPKSRSATQPCDEKTWTAMRNRVVAAHQAFDKKRVEDLIATAKGLIATGKFEDAIEFCDAKNMIPDDVKDKLKSEAINARLAKLIATAKDLIATGKFEDAIEFCDAKNMIPGDVKDKLKSEAINASLAKLQYDVSLRVDEFIGKGMFAEAEALIKKESQSPIVKRTEGPDPLLEIRDRLLLARETCDKNHVKSLIQSGKYEDALKFCDGQNTLLRADVAKREIVNFVVKELGDGKQLVQVYNLIDDVNLRDEIVMKLAQLKALSLLSQEQLVAIVNSTENDDVVATAIGAIDDKKSLVSCLDSLQSCPGKECWSKRGLKVLLEKIGDADVVRARIWDCGNENDLCVYVSVLGSDGEGLKLIQMYPHRLTGKVIDELRPKIMKEEIRAALEELESKEIAALAVDAIVERVRGIDDEALRSKMALRVLYLLPQHPFIECGNSYSIYRELVAISSRPDIGKRARGILDACSKRIHFEGFYVGMSLQDYCIMEAYHGIKPAWSLCDYDFKYLAWNHSKRYKLFNKEDGEFWPAFMRKYIPAGKKKSLGETIGDALDAGSYDYQEAYDDKLEEVCYIYKSMKHGTKVLFGQTTGTLVLEAY